MRYSDAVSWGVVVVCALKTADKHPAISDGDRSFILSQTPAEWLRLGSRGTALTAAQRLVFALSSPTISLDYQQHQLRRPAISSRLPRLPAQADQSSSC